MNTKILNITNGNCFNSYFLSRFGGEAIPFREAMMDGDAAPDIYSEEFIALRSSSLEVSTEEYKSDMLVCHALSENDYGRLDLWFGKDTFCQLNLLTLLAYLEQIRYSGRVFLNYIDDETCAVLESDIEVELGSYKKLYEDILILKRVPDDVKILVPEAIALYFDYHSDNGALAKTVRANSNLEHLELVCLLIVGSKAYGLSDEQAEKLIKKYKYTE